MVNPTYLNTTFAPNGKCKIEKRNYKIFRAGDSRPSERKTIIMCKVTHSILYKHKKIPLILYPVMSALYACRVAPTQEGWVSELVYFIRPFLGVWKACVARLNEYLIVRLVIVVSLDTTESTLPKPIHLQAAEITI